MGKQNTVVLAGLLLAAISGCDQSRSGAIASSRDELTARCIDAGLAQEATEWAGATLDATPPRVTKGRDSLMIGCPFTLADGNKAVLSVLVVCPADTAVQCESFPAL